MASHLTRKYSLLCFLYLHHDPVVEKNTQLRKLDLYPVAESSVVPLNWIPFASVHLKMETDRASRKV